MSGYPLRSRLTKSGTSPEDDTNPPPSSVSSVPSRIHTSFRRDRNRTEISKGGRGRGGDPARDTSRRERGVNIPRFSRVTQREKGIETDKIS
jgi:hypothetical protein